MNEIFTLIVIGIALSMDAFSISLGIGTLSLANKKQLIMATVVGIFHFFMPLLGSLLGKNVVSYLHIESHFLMTLILLLIAFEMLKESFSNEEFKIKLNIVGIIGFALTVSLDSFSTGLGLSVITSNFILAGIMFCLISFVFTYLGLLIGKYSKKVLGKYATTFGAVLLIIIALIHFLL